MSEALIGFGAIFALALLRVPLAFAMGLVGFVGLGLLRGWPATMANTAQVVYDTGFAYTLSVIPLFILMGNFVARAGLAHPRFNGPRRQRAVEHPNPCSRQSRARESEPLEGNAASRGGGSDPAARADRARIVHRSRVRY